MHTTLIRSLFAALSAVAVAGSALAQDLGVKAPPQKAPVVINGATVHPISGPAIEQGHVVFDNGVITAVGSGPAPSVSGATVIDGAGKHVYPGLVGANTQMGLMEIGAVRATIDMAETNDVSPEVRAAVAVNPDSTLIPVTRSNGVLTVGVIPMGGLIPGRLSVIRMDGWTWEDLAISDDAGLVVNWPNMRTMTGRFFRTTPEEQAEQTRKSLATIDNAFEAAGAYFAACKADPTTEIDTRWEAMRAVIEGGKPVYIRAQELEQIESAVSWAVRLGLNPIIIGGRDADLCTDLLKRHNVPVIVAGTHRVPRRADAPYDSAYTLPLALQQAGVRFCIAGEGGNSETPHERNLPYHAASAVAHGLNPDDALRAITLDAAALLGVADRLGSLETGKSATIIVTDGNPLEITTVVEMAFIDGRQIDLANKQTDLADKYREKYRQLGILND